MNKTPSHHPEDPAMLSIIVSQSEAFQINQRFEALTTYNFLLDRNYNELVRLLRGGQSSEAFDKLWTHDKRFEMNVIIREIIRLLHNFVASVQTVIEHTRTRMREWYADSQVLKDYEAEVRRIFADDLIAGFVEDLRDYSLHFTLPVTVATFKEYTITPLGNRNLLKHLFWTRLTSRNGIGGDPERRNSFAPQKRRSSSRLSLTTITTKPSDSGNGFSLGLSKNMHLS